MEANFCQGCRFLQKVESADLLLISWRFFLVPCIDEYMKKYNKNYRDAENLTRHKLLNPNCLSMNEFVSFPWLFGTGRGGLLKIYIRDQTGGG